MINKKGCHFGTRVRTLYVFLRMTCVWTVTSDRVRASASRRAVYTFTYTLTYTFIVTHVTMLKLWSYIHTSEGGTILIHVSKLVAHLKNKNWLQFEVDKASAACAQGWGANSSESHCHTYMMKGNCANIYTAILIFSVLFRIPQNTLSSLSTHS